MGKQPSRGAFIPAGDLHPNVAAASLTGMEADDPRIKDFGVVLPHRWQECTPVIRDRNGQLVPGATEMINKIFRTLRADERIKFHQFTCLRARTPVHLAAIEKIDKRLKAAGLF